MSEDGPLSLLDLGVAAGVKCCVLLLLLLLLKLNLHRI